MSPVVQVRDLRFSHGPDPAHGFSLSVPVLEVAQGGRLAVVGPSGSGKSTLLDLLAGVRTPRSGTVQVCGTAVETLGPVARRAFRIRHVGFVFQDFPLVPHLDAVENVLLPYRLHPELRLDRPARERALELLAQVGLDAQRRRRPDALSQGERQRVALCRAVVTQPKLILADEPTTGLDPAARDRVCDWLDGLVQAGGQALILVTHDAAVRDRFDQTLTLPGAV